MRTGSPRNRILPLVLVCLLAALSCGGKAPAVGPVVRDVGFRTPESVLHDPVADIYLVANINGQPTVRDGNGFISRVTPEGKVEALKWIAGGVEGVTLNAPKGMALAGDRLWVADIDVVRAFDRKSGLPLAEIPVPGAGFLNDVAAAPDGTLFVSDMATDEIIRISPGGEVTVFNAEPIASGPNGLSLHGGNLWVAVSNPNRLVKLDAAGASLAEVPVPGGGLDGLICLPDGSMLVSSWSESAVYFVNRDRHAGRAVEDLPAPADIGWDAQRRAILVPLFRDDAVEVYRLP